MISQYNEFVENQQKALSYQGHLITVSVHNVSGFNDQMGGSRKFPYPYHGRHLGIPKGGGYIDYWNSEDMGGFIGLEF